MCITASYGSMRSPSKSACTSSSSKSYAQSLRIAIASSIPPSHASFFWKICMTTRGQRSSCNSVSRAWLKYASVYQPARIFSAGRSKISGWSLVLVVCAMFELEAGGECCLRDLELLRRRLGRGEAVLELVPRLRQRLGDEVLRVARHPAEDLRRGGDCADLRGRARAFAQPVGREPGENVADGRRCNQRSDEMATTPLVLLGRPFAMLVSADRDVLGAVIGGELSPAQRERRGRERQEACEQLLCRGADATRVANPAHDERRGEHRPDDTAGLHR